MSKLGRGAAFGFALRFVLVFGVLIAPWPGWNLVYSHYFQAMGSMAFNPAGTICEVPMETESARGTAHVALGNSIAYGGEVNAIAHLDCVMRDATLELDGRSVMIEGELQ